MTDLEIDYIHAWDDGPMDGVAAHRASVPAMLDQISRRSNEPGISIAVFSLVPNSADAILTYSTPAISPDDATSTVARSLGLRGTRRRKLRCTTTLDQKLRNATA